MAGVFGVVALVAPRTVNFLAGAPHTSNGLPRARARLGAWPWEGQGDARADEAFLALQREFPEAVKKGNFLGTPTDRSAVVQRYEGLAQIFGREFASDMVDKEPYLLLEETSCMQGSWGYLKRQETPEQQGLALEIVQKNPKILTVAEREFERTKPTLDSLASVAAAIDFLRPFGPIGLSVAIFGSFVVLITVLRPILYGVNGGPSLISMVLSPITSNLPPIPNPAEVLEANGINLSLLIVLYPISVVLKGIFDRFSRQ